MRRMHLQVPILAMLCGLLLSACVKDTDFDQAENITLTPVVELDLIHFDLSANNFFDQTSNTPRLMVSDTTEIRFLDDTEIQESLKRAEFLFVFENSIPRTFQVDFEFLSEQNEQTYVTATTVSEGNEQTPVVTEFVHNVEGDDILQLTMADKVVVSVTIPSATATLAGNLNLKSKTTYYLEIKERN